MEVVLVEEAKRDPREDIFLIRQMLERSMDGMKSLAPWCSGFGFVWLFYGAFSALQRIVMLRVSPLTAGQVAFAGSILGLLFCIVLAIGFLVCSKRMAYLGFGSLVQKLVNMWGVCIFIYLAMTMLVNPGIQTLSVQLGYSAEAAAALYKACALSRSFLFFLFPVAPLLITAEFLDSRRMVFLGIVLAMLAAMAMCCHAILLFGDNLSSGIELWYFWFGAACLLDLAPGTMLLVFGHQLKGR